MECTTHLQTTQQIQTSEIVGKRKIAKIEQSDCYDEATRKHRKYLAQQEALRRLERIKVQALMVFRR